MEEEEGFENVPSDGPKSLQEKCHKEREGVEEERRAGVRCHQDQREISGDQPSELDAAALAVPDSIFPLVSLHGSPHQFPDSVDFDLELTAEVRVEDGSSLAFLSSISHRFHSRKSGTLLDHLPLQLKRQSSTWISKQEEQFLNNCLCPTFLPTQPQVISVTPASIRNTISVSLLGAMQAAKSPLPSCPSTSPSSPSSAPSSPSSSSSSSSSPVAAVTSFHDGSRGCVAGVTQSDGGAVSSTSVSLPPPTWSFPPSSSTPSVHHCSTPPHPCSGEDQENVEIYDPFHPTEGEGEREGGAAKEEEEEEDKYDPFDPTGSPASEREKDRKVERTVSAESERRETMGVTGEQKAGSDKDEKEMAPSYCMAPPRASPFSTDSPSQHPRHREERAGGEREQERGGRGKGSRERVKDNVKGGRKRKEINSDNSEIEEGEIVAAGERDRKRERRRDREGERGHLPDSSFLPSCPKPERILRVLEGDDFVSVRAEGDWVVERDGGTTAGVGDLRRKLVSRQKERYQSCPSSASLSPPHPRPLATPTLSLPVPTEKAKSRKSSKGSKERERRKRKQERDGEKGGKSRRKRTKEGGSQDNKERDNDSERWYRDKKRKEAASWSSRSGSSKRKKRPSTPELSSHSRSHTSSLHQRHSRCSWSSTVEDRHKDRDREREHERDRDRDRNRKRDEKERGRERDHSSQRRKRERGGGDGQLGDEERGVGCRQWLSRERREQAHEMNRRRDGRPVVPPSIQDLSGSDLFAIKRTITVTTTTTTTTVPGSPQLPQTSPNTPPLSSNNQRKKKHRRQRRLEEEDYAEDEERLSRSGDSSLTPLRYRLDYDSDHFSDRLGVDMLSLDGEAMDSDFSLEGSPLPLPPMTPTLSTKNKPKLKSGIHSKKKSRTGKKTTELFLRQKAKKSPPSLSPTSTPSVPAPTLPMLPVAKRARKMGKEKVGKKEGGRSGKSKTLSNTKKGKLQSKVSVLVREGVSSTTGGSGLGKLGVIASTKDLPGPCGAGSGTVVGGSIAVVFRRDNESRSPFLKPSSEPILLSGRSKDFGKARKTSTLIPSSSSSAHISVLKSKKAKPSSTTSASSSAASSPSSFSLTKCRRKQEKKQREREKGGVSVEGDGANANSCVEGSSRASSVSDIQSGSTGSAKPSSPPPGPPAPTPSSSFSSASSSSSSTSVPLPSSPPCTPPLCMHLACDTRESTPDSQTVDSSCKTPEPNFLSEDGPTQSQTTPLTPPSNVPSSPLPHQAVQGGVSGISHSTPDHKNPVDEQETPTSPACSSSSNSLSVAPSSVDPNSSVSSSSANKPPPPLPPQPAAQPLPWSLQTGVDCTAGGVLAWPSDSLRVLPPTLGAAANCHSLKVPVILGSGRTWDRTPDPRGTTAQTESLRFYRYHHCEVCHVSHHFLSHLNAYYSEFFALLWSCVYNQSPPSSNLASI
ncbi:hypothetical protein SKAU_G00131440 [Synaphobranchus kaupii]|uniref:Uncharacterized protein n=1 Tax=Synaphobranchus kaupii TaxID=118154 RepID=A0A9Q1FRI7_SYNKA|nr:hypothetical protein SKAU_G00131440 [Synaphobranchus kaupii]